jgi:tetratricopeptide (TPR) repeat protein
VTAYIRSLATEVRATRIQRDHLKRGTLLRTVLKVLPKFFFKSEATAKEDSRVSDPGRCAELKKRGNQLLAQGKLFEAGCCYREATHADPEDALAFVNLGYALSEQKNFMEAQAALEQALRLDSGLQDAHFILGQMAQQLGERPKAIHHFKEAIRLEPDFELAYRELGHELYRAEETDEAEKVILEGIRRFPASSDLHCNLGNLYGFLNLPLKAIEHFETALTLEPQSPQIMSNLGGAYNLSGDPDRAIDLLQHAMELTPKDADIQCNLGLCMFSKGRYDEALQYCQATVGLDPNHDGGHLMLGLTSLLLGDFERGWTEYEWRLKDRYRPLKAIKSFPQPSWLGAESIQGKTILLHCEEGFGDTLQFCRFAAEVAARGATVVLLVQRGLKEVLTGLAGVTYLIEEGEPLPEFDCHCPLQSLPLALGYHKFAKLPPQRPYLRADPQRVQYWRLRLGEVGMRRAPLIGVVWSGNPNHRRDHQRSIPLAEFMRLLPADMKAISLQPAVRESDLPALQANPRIVHVGRELKNFAETAALIAALDLVIAVDTSVVHLAGAMGKPVWVLVPHSPDWRWLLNRDDSDWYPSARIFRQGVVDDWRQPLQEVHNALLAWAQR